MKVSRVFLLGPYTVAIIVGIADLPINQVNRLRWAEFETVQYESLKFHSSHASLS